MNINFRLQPDKRGKEERSIMVRVGGKPLSKRIDIIINQKVFEEQWDSDKQRVIAKGKKRHPDAKEINSFIENIILRIEKEVRMIELNDASIHPHEEYAESIRNIFKTEEPKADFFEVFEEFLNIQSQHYSYNTIKNYRTLKQHLLDFQKVKKFKFTFESIDIVFEDKFVNYLYVEKKHTNTTKSKNMGLLKAFMNWTFERGYHDNLKFKKFSIEEDKKQVIYLKESELKSIIQLKLETGSRLDRVRDVFIFQCFTGQRYSDINRLTWANITENSIEIRTVKTRDLISIPLMDETKQIIAKYKDKEKPLPTISNQKYNDYIKELCKMSGIDTKIILTYYIGKERIEKILPKYELITSHKARSTFVTLSLIRGMNPETIMQITGHTDMKMMKKYLKISKGFVKSDYEKAWGK